MLALRGLEACICPERGTQTCPPIRITRPGPIPGIRTTRAPAGFEFEPGEACHRLETVFLCRVILLLPFLQHGELLLFLIGALLPFVQLARRGLNLPAAVGAEEVRHGVFVRVELPVGFPAIARKNMLLVVDRIEPGEQILLRFQDRLTPRDLLLAHNRPPLASKSAGERVGEDSNHGGRLAFGTSLHETGDIAMPVDENYLGFGPGGSHLCGVLLGYLLRR